MMLPNFLHLLSNPANDHSDLGNSLIKEMMAMQVHFNGQRDIQKDNVIYYSKYGSNWDYLDTHRANPESRKEMVYFHFSGHGDDGNLIFQSEEGHENEARKKGLANTLAAFPNLHFVFLNCCTSDLLAEEIANENRIVIASPYDVPTMLAVEMADTFYKHFTLGNNLAESYAAAVDNLHAIPGDKYRATFTMVEDEIPDPSTIFQFYPDLDAKGGEFTLPYLREKIEMDLENPTAGSEPKLLRPLLYFNFRDQRRSVDPQEKMMAYLIRGKEEFGVPLVYWMIKEPFIKKNALRIQIRLSSLNRSFTVFSYWKELAVGLKLVDEDYEEPEQEADKEAFYKDVIAATAKRIRTTGKDVFIAVYDGQQYGDGELPKVVREFWEQLKEGVHKKTRPLKPKSRLMFFICVEHKNYEELTQKLKADETKGTIKFVKEPGELSEQDIIDFTEREKVMLLPEDLQDSWLEISQAIHEDSKGVPGEALQMFCNLTEDSYETLNQTFIEI